LLGKHSKFEPHHSLLFSILSAFLPLGNLGGKVKQVQALKPDRLETELVLELSSYVALRSRPFLFFSSSEQ
jgi:hypothetical protein